MKYLKKSGELKDALVVRDILAAAKDYEDGAIVEACDALVEIANDLLEFIKNEELR